MTITELKTVYGERIAQFELERKELSKKKVVIGWGRLLCFLMIPSAIYVFFPNWLLILPIVLVLLASFLALIAYFTDLQNRLAFIERLIASNQAELLALDNDYKSFDCGAEFSDPMHPYAVDMDLFHPNGLFAFLNRTVTPEGKRMLANYLLSGNKRASESVIDDLKPRLDWRQRFLTGAYVEHEESSDAAANWLNFSVNPDGAIRILRFLLPVLSWTALFLWQFNVLTELQFILMLLIPLGLIGASLKETNKMLFTASKAGAKWRSMLSRLSDLEKEEFVSDEMKTFQSRMTGDEQSTKNALKRIVQLNNLADYRLNMLMGIVLNVFLAWDYWMRTLLTEWLTRYATQFDQWDDDLAELEVWICAANYAYNRDDLSYAELSGDEISIVALGHPLLSHQSAVKNDFKASETCAFSIITGPNMAGKSTFLRAVGVNLVLAHCGFPVVAQVFAMPNLRLYSSMRTSDDLASSSSYFFAELSRLRFIVDAIERGEKVFIILDEILKGTNSIDKEKGSAAFLEKLKQLGAKGIIATHDLSLCQLSDGNDAFQNLYFDSIIEYDELSFDYKIRQGVCQNMNASFLLKKMGLT